MKIPLFKQVVSHNSQWMYLLVILLGFNSACQRQPTGESKAVHHQDGNESHHSEEHEHFPRHWPYSVFRAATRLSELSSLKDSAKPSEVSLEREFVDLIRWLPELVADSDLSEQEFNRIDAWVSRNADLLEKQQTGGSTLSDMLRTDGLVVKIEELAEACRIESERRQALE